MYNAANHIYAGLVYVVGLATKVATVYLNNTQNETVQVLAAALTYTANGKWEQSALAPSCVIQE